MAARLEVHVDGRAPRLLARLLERHDFGVLAVTVEVRPSPDDPPVAHDDRADERVRAYQPEPLLSRVQRGTHVLCVLWAIGHGGGYQRSAVSQGLAHG